MAKETYDDDTTTQELAVMQPVAGDIDPEGLLAPMHGGWWSRQYPGRVNRVAILEDDALALWTDWARRWIEQWCGADGVRSYEFKLHFGENGMWNIYAERRFASLKESTGEIRGPSLAHALAAAIGQLKEKT